MADSQNQARHGARNYNLHCQSQSSTFQKLISKVDIQPGWKILDFGCGTGNNTVLLADMVGAGIVIGIDPDKERIEEARTVHHQRGNLKFYVASEKNMLDYGKGYFDLIVASNVIHWLTREQNEELFQNAYQSLVNHGWFISVVVSEHASETMWPIVSLIGDLGDEINQIIHRESKQYYEELAISNGFSNVVCSDGKSRVTFESVSDALKWFASTFYTRKYNEVLQRMEQVCEKEDVSFLFNKDGVPYNDADKCFVQCLKIT